MGRTGTLPETCYHKELRPSASKEYNGAIDSEQESMKSDTDNADEVLEYDTDIDEEKTIQNEIGNEPTILLGAN